MDRTAVFVDAGYLFAAGSKLLANEKLPRGQLNLNYDVVLKLLGELTTEVTGLPLLRIYWYDGTATGPTPQQLALAYRPNVKLRLGFVNQQGEQKGVDSLVVADLINLARNRAMADVLLMTGDEDIRVGVQQVQEFGVRVHLLGISPARENQSGFLVQEADSVRELSLAEVQSFLSRVPQTTAPATPQTTAPATPQTTAPATPPATAPATAPATPPATAPAALSSAVAAPVQSAVALTTTLETAAQRIAGELKDEEKEAVLKESVGGSVPSQIDRRLLLAGNQALGGTPLTPTQKRRVRAAFLDACRKAKS